MPPKRRDAKAKAAPARAKAEARGKAKAAPAARGAAKATAKRKADTPAAAASSSSAKKAKTGPRVDPVVPGRDKYSVVDDWSVLLNQTNVGANNNKFYRIQLLQEGSKYYCWTRWGRVGVDGQNKMEPAGSFEVAKKLFTAKFRQKTNVDYNLKDGHDWTPRMGKYTLVETEEQEGGGGGDAPLGKLTVQQIERGQTVLQKLEAAVKKGRETELQTLSSQFYTLIPHNFGFRVPPAINTPEMVEAEQELLKFYLRMGFEEVEADQGLSPINGIMDLDLPATLDAAAGKLCSAKDVKESSDKGKQHAKRQSGKPTTTMEAHLYGAIMLYTSNAIYQDLNKVLRSEDRTKIKKYFLYLRLLLEALARLPQKPRTLWRGISVDLSEQYTKGSTITWWGVSSCTADINVAKNFMKGCGGSCTLLTIQSQTAADISEITFFGNEKESLLAPGTKLKVMSSSKKGNVTEMTLKEVGRELG